MYTTLPALSTMFTSLFFCMELDPGQYWFQKDLQLKCWEGMHLKFALGLGLPSIIFWIIIVPIFSLYVVYQKRKQLQEPEVVSRYRMIFHGFKEQYFYWEYVNLIRKIFLILTNVFLNLFVSNFKALLALLILTVLMRIQYRLKPYKNPIFNLLEQREQLASVVTFFGALFFINTDISLQVQMTAFILIMLFNFWFIFTLFMCFLMTLKYEIAAKIAKCLFKTLVIAELRNEYVRYKRNNK